MPHGRLVLAAALLLLALGCRHPLPDQYGRRAGNEPDSVNGTAALADMVARRGHAIYSWNRLSPRLNERADCIMWFPDNFEPPTDAQCQWLERWLTARPGRTLIFVGRYYDAAGKYWRQAAPKAPASQQPTMRQNALAADSDLKKELASVSGDNCRWFTLRKDRPAAHVTVVDGWIDEEDPLHLTQCDIDLATRLVPLVHADVVVRDPGGEPIVSRIDVRGGQILLVANGSFLLNHALVNHDHRRLAGRLIDEIGPPKQTVVFLESGRSGPPIDEKDPDAKAASPWALFQLWPVGLSLLHFLVAGALLSLSRWPIFGVPRRESAQGLSDFGRHVEAVGQWLSRTRNAAFARTRLQHYRQLVDDG